MNRGRLKLVIIFAAFLGPLLASFIWYYGFGGAFAPRTASNHAPLISPPVALAPFSNPVVDGAGAGDGGDNAPFNLDALKRQWTVVHLLTGECAEPCQRSLYNTRQTRLALGKDARRIRRIIIAPNRAQLQRLAPDHPDATQLLKAQTGLETQLTPLIRHHRLTPHDALLIDPLGNLMMTLPPTLNPALLLKDLKKLLKLSRIG